MSDPDQTRQPDDAPETLGDSLPTRLPPTDPALDSLQTRFNPDDDSLATQAPGDTSTPWEGAIAGFPGYELLETLGEGGMGTVFKARQEGLNRLVALKVILGGRRASPKDLIRFLAEAEAVASIKHPHVVQVHEYGEVDGRPFLTLEYLPGGTLADRLKSEKRLEPKVAAKLVAKLARAVQDAHDQGIVHRDLKPANVLFDAENEPKVTDFGLAKRAKGTDLTQTQAIMGTPAYMSPEQAKGNTKFVGPPADIYALGVILYECLAGNRPFHDIDTHVLLRQVIEDEPLKPSKHIPGLPRDLELITLKCLAKEPEDRYPTAKALAEDLAHFTAGEPVSVRATGTIERTLKWAKRKPTQAAAYALTCAVVILMAFGASLAVLWRQAEDERKQAVNARLGETKERQNAEAARDTARKAEGEVMKARDQLAVVEYGRTMQVAHQDWREKNIFATLTLLNGTKPELRGWEWRYLNHLCHPELLVLKKSVNELVSLNGVEWSPDGSRLMTTNWSHPRVWDARTGEQIMELKGHAKSVNSASWSRDGSRIVTASVDNTAKVWDAATGKPVLTLEGHFAALMEADWSPDGSRIATASMDGTAKVWDAKTGSEVLELKSPVTAWIFAVAWSPDGSQIATASTEDLVRIWDVRTGAETFTLKGHTSYVQPVRWSPDGSRIATASLDKTARLWDARTGTEILVLKHPNVVRSLSWSPDSSRIATGSDDALARVWDARTGAEVLAHKGHTDNVSSVAWSPDGSRIATASRDGTGRIWNARIGGETLFLKGHENSVWSVAWSFDDSRIATASGDQTVRVWNPTTGAEVLTLKGHTSPVNSVAWSPDGLRIATASGESLSGPRGDHTVKVWDARTGTELLTINKDDFGAVSSVAWSPDGSRLACAIENCTARIWDAKTGAEILTIKGHDDAVNTVSWSPDGSRIATGSGSSLGNSVDDTMRVWDAKTGALIFVYKGHDTPVNSVAWSPDGLRIATASGDVFGGARNDNTGRVLDAKTGAELLILKGHTDLVRGISWSPNGSRVATASRDGTTRLWDTKTGAEVLTLKDEASAVFAVSWSRDGSRIATANGNTIRIWDARSGAER